MQLSKPLIAWLAIVLALFLFPVVLTVIRIAGGV